MLARSSKRVVDTSEFLFVGRNNQHAKLLSETRETLDGFTFL